ncbi:MAG: hypothetical protein PHT69_00900 [Bacteroidales bacterium]|nr:hypothetical protein [Bacteroidales bacterium]
MLFNISGFTHQGTYRKINQDRVLINGQLIDSGVLDISKQTNCISFLTDGVGGNAKGEFAASFVLEAINNIDISEIFSKHDEKTQLMTINDNLLQISKTEIELKGTATTLTGLYINDSLFKIIHAGDSELWLLRNGIFFKITNDMHLDNDVENSPITSYFGGLGNYLTFQEDFNLAGSEVNDIFMLCSDGLFKSLTIKIVKNILLSDKSLTDKSHKILSNALEMGAIDNISAVLIERIE